MKCNQRISSFKIFTTISVTPFEIEYFLVNYSTLNSSISDTYVGQMKMIDVIHTPKMQKDLSQKIGAELQQIEIKQGY